MMMISSRYRDQDNCDDTDNVTAKENKKTNTATSTASELLSVIGKQ